ncbi:hypothetical protein GCM10011391_06630 [Pullulanibacillus camelliae]|uniref:Tetratricopeptide repeat protein n=1 Tax=Pullulanibacillus camelliae TaxID=1707096 RepID=A0A8J2VM71_9BACL|nr:tetratricopeptide repeat protein [Pullulanibacillus camelliae]GGE30641.1 hypothetical protein GCM10011391_06630 [Pullulanibacillus camelliae]
MEAIASRMNELLNELYFYVKVQNVTRAKYIQQQLEEQLVSTPLNEQLVVNYLVAKYGYALLNVDFENAKKFLNQIEQSKHLLDDQWCYRFYLFRGLHSIIWNSDFANAQNSFEVAEQRLSSIDDAIEKAEYDYKMAFMYYHLKDPLHSVQYITKALDIYRDKSDFRRKCASCELILGLNSIDMKQYEEAEEQFYKVLDYANSVDDKDLKAQVLHNLGLLYAEQNKPAAAIHWLNERLKIEQLNYLTAYLLSRENFKLGRTKEALSWLNKGIELCQYIDNREYLMRFHLLKTYYLNVSKENFESAYREGIAYFYKEKFWSYVDEYGEQLAHFLRQQEEYEEAAEYYALASEARHKIIEMEGLN